MAASGKIPLEDAKIKFSGLFQSVDANDVEMFRIFAIKEMNNSLHGLVKSKRPSEIDDSFENSTDCLSDPFCLLDSIAVEIQKLLPYEKTIPWSYANHDLCVYVDEFLYGEDDVEKLVEDGKLVLNYCENCGQKNIKPLTMQSQSMGRDALFYVFNEKLPTLDGKVVLDINSTVGAALYGAYAFSDAKKIVGLVSEKKFLDLQQKIIQAHDLGDRIEVINDKLSNQTELVQSCDVLIWNNFREPGESQPEQMKVQSFLRDNLKKGAIIVIRPRLDVVTDLVGTWLKPYKNPSSVCDSDDDRFCNIEFFEVA